MTVPVSRRYERVHAWAAQAVVGPTAADPTVVGPTVVGFTVVAMQLLRSPL